MTAFPDDSPGGDDGVLPAWQPAGISTTASQPRPGRGGNPPAEVTPYDVARRAGVSTATVSRVLHRPDTVRETTRARVHAAIGELGYVPDREARPAVAGGGTRPYKRDLKEGSRGMSGNGYVVAELDTSHWDAGGNRAAGLERVPVRIRTPGRCGHGETVCVACAESWMFDWVLYFDRTAGGRLLRAALGGDAALAAMARRRTDWFRDQAVEAASHPNDNPPPALARLPGGAPPGGTGPGRAVPSGRANAANVPAGEPGVAGEGAEAHRTPHALAAESFPAEPAARPAPGRQRQDILRQPAHGTARTQPDKSTRATKGGRRS